MKLNKREKILSIAVGLFAATFLFKQLILGPFSDKLDLLEVQITSGERELKRLFYINSQKTSIKGLYNKLKEYIETGDTGIDLVPVIMNNIENMAMNCGVKLLNMKPVAARAQEEDKPYNTKKITLSVEGQQREAIKFLYKLENSNYPIRITRLDLQVKDKVNNVMEADISLEFIYFDK